MALISPCHPSHKELRRRKCDDSKECSFCLYKGESIEHVFILCWWSRAFWVKMAVDDVTEVSQMDIAQWMIVHANRGTESLRKLIVGVWVIWKCKLMARAYLHQFSNSRTMHISSSNEPAVIHREKWTIFTDGSSCKLTCRGGLCCGGPKRESHSRALCKAGRIEDCKSPVDAEMRGVLAGVEIAQKLCALEADFVSDSTSVVWFLRSDLGAESHPVSERNEAFCAFSDHPGWSSRFIFRVNNALADALAKFALRYCWCWSRADAIPWQVVLFKRLDFQRAAESHSVG